MYNFLFVYFGCFFTFSNFANRLFIFFIADKNIHLPPLPKPYLRLPELYFFIAAKPVNLVADVILKALDVLPVGIDVK